MIAVSQPAVRPPFPSPLSSRTVLAVQGPLRRAKTARPGPLRAVPKILLIQGKGGLCAAPSHCPYPKIRPPPLDHVNNLQASLQLPVSFASTAYSHRRNVRFTSPEYALDSIACVRVLVFVRSQCLPVRPFPYSHCSRAPRQRSQLVLTPPRITQEQPDSTTAID